MTTTIVELTVWVVTPILFGLTFRHLLGLSDTVVNNATGATKGRKNTVSLTTETLANDLTAYCTTAETDLSTPHRNPSKLCFFSPTYGWQEVEDTTGDIYDLLTAAHSLDLGLYKGHLDDWRDTAIGIQTYGWAAPLPPNGEPEIAPSQHSERIRVALSVVHRGTGEKGALVTFSDGRESSYDDSTGTGALADSLDDLCRKWYAEDTDKN
jgi:hypothetical protein